MLDFIFQGGLSKEMLMANLIFLTFYMYLHHEVGRVDRIF
jgi:hypothetical protein